MRFYFELFRNDGDNDARRCMRHELASWMSESLCGRRVEVSGVGNCRSRTVREMAARSSEVRSLTQPRAVMGCDPSR